MIWNWLSSEISVFINTAKLRMMENKADSDEFQLDLSKQDAKLLCGLGEQTTDTVCSRCFTK